MAFDGVLAFQGRDHITASQLGRIVEGVAGKGRYVLPTLHGLKATMQTANKVRVDTGDLVIDGRVVTNEEAVDLTVESGTSGYKRNDLVVCHYRKDASTGVERFDAKVLKGTPTTGTPADPTYDAGDISAGGSEAIMPLWRIPIDGITPGTPVQVADTAQSLKSLGDSVSHHLDTGWVYLYNDAKWGTVKYRARDGVCCLMVSGVGGIGAGTSWAVPNAIAKKFLPPSGLYATLSHRQKNNIAQVWIPGQGDVNSDGKLYIYSSMTTDDNFSRISGVVTWIYEPEPVDPEA